MSSKRPNPSTLDLDPELRAAFGDEPGEAFDRILALDGRVYREIDGRRTLRFALGEKGYFLKAHLGTTWGEILKNLFSLQRPVLGADVERRAIKRFDEIGIETTPVKGYGSRGSGPTTRQSFLITEELSGTASLEDYCRNWPEKPPSFRLRRALIETVAELVRRMHANGVHHRDCYACHFLLDLDSSVRAEQGETPRLFVIDLHRAELGDRIRDRARVKDLAGLLFSSLDFGLTRTDLLRFASVYLDAKPRDVVRASNDLWRRVRARGERLYRKVHEREPPPR
jgi:heptose I phosphotransferase